MKRRGKRIAFTVAAAGLAVVLVLGTIHRGAVRDHLEAWHFQLTRKTKTVTPGSAGRSFTSLCEKVGMGPRSVVQDEVLLGVLAERSGRSVIWDPAGPTWAFVLGQGEELRTAADATRILRAGAWRVLDQRFPRRAHIVLHDEPPPGAAGDPILVASEASPASRVLTLPTAE